MLGLADNSLMLLPGSTDVATILLAAHHRSLWPYYATMATAGAVLSGLGVRVSRDPRYPPATIPIVPMLLAAGAMQYPTRTFLAALTVGRGIRFTLRGYLGAHYGRHIVNFFAQYYRPVLGVLIAFSVVGGLYAPFGYKRRRKAEGPKTSRPSSLPRRRTA